MKKYLQIILIGIFILALSCSKDKDYVYMRVNHYQQTATGVGQRLVILTQEGNEIGTDNWSYFYSNIRGFNYELGYVYDLEILKEKIYNPPADGSSIKYTLEKLISKVKTNDSITFNIFLKSVERSNPPSYITGDSSIGFKILNDIEIDCNDLCDELSESLINDDDVSGLFKHSEGRKIKLVDLIIE